MGKFRAYVVITTLFLFLLALAPPASADHTNPRTPLAPTEGTTATGIVRGGGTWKHIANFPGGASNALTGGGTDLEFFNVGKQVYGAFGTLGQDDVGSVGQRFIQLTQKGQVAPRWVADHGSGHCTTSNPSGTTGLQHDTQIARKGQITLLTDTTDATGRCHDPNGGGIEIVDVSKIGIRRFQPREVHLVRFAGFSHTHTVDGRFPWIVYNSSSDFSGRNWIDVMDMNSCFGSSTWTLAQRRAGCRPTVARIPFQDTWTQQRDQNTNQLEPGSAACHDITYQAGRLYCAGVNASLIIDVSGLLDSAGKIKGTSFTCPVIDGTRTGAKVTDCSGMEAGQAEQATGWTFLGTFQHPGRDCGPPGTDVRNCNSNNQVRSDEGVAVSHEADPTANERLMFVTDERGGGIVPPGSSCAPGIDNPFGNGGAHAFNISDPSNIRYAAGQTARRPCISVTLWFRRKPSATSMSSSACQESSAWSSPTTRRGSRSWTTTWMRREGFSSASGRRSRCRTRTPGPPRTSRSSTTQTGRAPTIWPRTISIGVSTSSVGRDARTQSAVRPLSPTPAGRP